MQKALHSGKITENDRVENLIKNEKLFIKNEFKLPFLIELSYKLKAYDLIDELILDYEEMVEKIWQ